MYYLKTLLVFCIFLSSALAQSGPEANKPLTTLTKTPRANLLRKAARQNSRCRSTQYQCTSGQCIELKRLCDGRRDCADGSDESSLICYTEEDRVTSTESYNPPDLNAGNDGPPAIFRCRAGEFLCTSGECIKQARICDGYDDCQDGSDESPSICPGAGSIPLQSNIGGASNPGVDNGGEAEDWQGKMASCPTPRQPDHGHWQLHWSQCADRTRDCEAPRGLRSMPPGSYLVYKCEQGFELEGHRDVVCGPGGKWIHEPSCKEVRCPDLSSSATEALCVWNNVAVSCEVPAPVGTKAKLNCRHDFVQEVSYNATSKSVSCEANGKWKPQPIGCVRKPRRVKLVLEGDMIMED